ncbi:MAG: winged helix-turn-helix domain-containing protein [Thermoplasmata archaeon]|nr:winged helix-turn-helix domain-containing protein [Thermoplasmata archaeon]MCI4361792.1 winged helix-turn-helix domain-containing protein [Thermoplasmata archaeon]
MSPGFRSLMWYVLYGTRGGPNRRRILDELLRSPANAHQLAGALALDYRTVRHHLRLLEQSGAVTRPVGEAYASPYEIAASTAAYLETVDASPARAGTGRTALDRAAHAVTTKRPGEVR